MSRTSHIGVTVMDWVKGHLALVSFLALLGCHEMEGIALKSRAHLLSPQASDDRVLDESDAISECEPEGYQVMPQTEDRNMPSTWMDEAFIRTFLHNLDCYHLVVFDEQALDEYVMPGPDGSPELVLLTWTVDSATEETVVIGLGNLQDFLEDSLSQRLGVKGIVGEARELARTYLKNPRNVRRLYSAFRPQVIELLRASRNRQAIKLLMESLIPYFDQNFSDETIALSRRESAAYRYYLAAVMSGDAIVERADRAQLASELSESESLELVDGLTAAIEDVHNTSNEWQVAYDELADAVQYPEAMQWVLRRQDEGGRPLVRAWGEILKDIHDSI